MPSNPLVVWYFCLCRIFFCRVLDIRVAERMGVDVGQPVADSELFQPVRDRIRVHGLPVVLSKNKVLIAVVFPQTEAFGGLPCSVFSQKLHRFHRQGDEPFRPFRLRCAFVNPDIGRIQDAAANVNSSNFTPLEIRTF